MGILNICVDSIYIPINTENLSYTYVIIERGEVHMAEEYGKWFSIATKGIIFYEGKFLIVKRSPHSYEASSTWEVPGGAMEVGEAPESSLLREIKEETGADVEIVRYLYSWKIPRNELHQTVGLTFLCKAKDNKVIISHEHSDYAWIHPNEILMYNFSQGILEDLKKLNWDLLSESL